MAVKPEELANLCATYKTLRTGCITESELKRRLHNSMIIESEVSPNDIISEGINYGFIKTTPRGIAITNLGNQLGQKQVKIAFQISEKAKEFMVKKIYLNPGSVEYCCGELLNKFRADTGYQTLVYDRSPEDSSEIVQWLKLLSRVGLLLVTTNRALVEIRHLNNVNRLLKYLREGIEEVIENHSILNQVGRIAEKYALKFEIERLTNLGYPELAKLVQCISLIDQSAGYDIYSYSGGKKMPEEPRYIEVKGTTNSEPQFTWSRNERLVAQRERLKYWIYCYDHVDITNETVNGPLKIRDPIKNIESKGFFGEPRDIFYFMAK
jgi:hypothetical protein